jgi:orotidine-5'-phosphate decarboxylase
VTRVAVAAHERLIVALDVATRDEALALVERIGDACAFYKIGMELLTSGDYFAVLEQLAARGKHVFVDLKFHDVPATVGAGLKGLSRYPVTFATIHGQDAAMMRAAAEANGGIRVLAGTVRTSLDRQDLEASGIRMPLAELVEARARAALAAGCDGVIASGQEALALRRSLDHRLVVVCPGIRPAAAGDDQKRIVDVPTAFGNGADYIVVGRPIRSAPDPVAMAETIQAQIAAAVA